MRTPVIRFVSRLLVVAIAVLPIRAGAGMIGTGAVVPPSQAATARARVAGFLDRAEVAKQLQGYGVSGQAAQERVAALTDAEVTELAGRLDSLPAGGDMTAIVIGVVVVFLLIWWYQMEKTGKPAS